MRTTGRQITEDNYHTGNLNSYNKYVKKLLESGDAYIAFDTPKELQLKRDEPEQKNKDPFQYYIL